MERLAIFSADQTPRLNLGESVNGTLSVGRWLAIHPGSGSERKNWPERCWIELIGKLAQIEELNFLLVGGEVEGERLARLAGSLPPSRFKLAQNLSLPELAQWLKQCRAFVGQDSGITHLAAAVGLPGLILWGPTSEVIWRPRSQRMNIVREPKGLHLLSVTQIFTQVTKMLELVERKEL